ncbi:MAG TPA: polysaccharide biosynthesis/export family protein, partial [Verrucomicrobiales bacterium]|nr:polysaccharide biosynthesis/export family protein [Verrucomicrobiales bacterium]
MKPQTESFSRSRLRQPDWPVRSSSRERQEALALRTTGSRPSLRMIAGCVLLLIFGGGTASAQVPAGRAAGDGTSARSTDSKTPSGSKGPAAAANPQETQTLRPPSDNYILNRGDSIKLSVFQESDLDTECTLSKSGEASFPLIGSVQLSGKTVRTAEKLIEELYNRDYLVNPRVSLTLTGYAQHFVTVSGAVANPRVVAIPLEGRFDILAAIAAAGGTTEKADLRAVVLRPAAGGAGIRCDVTAMQANPALARALQPGDLLTVPQKV